MAVNQRRALVFVAEIVLLGIVTGVYFAVKNAIPTFRRGFFCDDESLMHPYKSNTVPYWCVVVFGFLLNGIGILVLSLVRARREISGCSKETSLHVLSIVWPQAVMIVYGFLAVSILTELPKNIIGRLRPHFLSVCQPSYNATCTPTTGYIENYVCTSRTATAHMLSDMRKSFPSGHTSSSVYFAVILMMLIRHSVRSSASVLLRAVLQVAVFTLALYVGVSRISDYKHHWSDVLAGGVLGLAVALVTFWIFKAFVGLNEEDAHRKEEDGITERGNVNAVL